MFASRLISKLANRLKMALARRSLSLVNRATKVIALNSIINFVIKARWLLRMLWLVAFEETGSLLAHSTVLFFCHDNNRGLDLGGKPYAQLADAMRDELESLGISCQTIALFGSSLTGRKAYGSPFSINKSCLFAHIKKKLFAFSDSTKQVYIRTLVRSRARLVISINSTSELAQAARDCRVFHVELLHAMGYQEVPWGWDSKEAYSLPQGILSLDSISTSTFAALESKGVYTKTIPNPFLRRLVYGKAASIPEEWRYSATLNGYAKKILVSLQWGYAGDHGVYTEFADILPNGLFYDELQELIACNSQVFWHFRLHPVQLRDHRYKKLRHFLDSFVQSHSNCEWLQSSRLPLPVIAKACSGNITMSSQICYEVAAMGVCSLLLCPTLNKGCIHERWFSDLVHEGYAIKSKPDIAELQGWLDSVSPIKPRDASLANDELWRNALEWTFRSAGISIELP